MKKHLNDGAEMEKRVNNKEERKEGRRMEQGRGEWWRMKGIFVKIMRDGRQRKKKRKISDGDVGTKRYKRREPNEKGKE